MNGDEEVMRRCREDALFACSSDKAAKKKSVNWKVINNGDGSYPYNYSESNPVTPVSTFALSQDRHTISLCLELSRTLIEKIESDETTSGS